MTRLHILSDLHIEFGMFECPSVDADVTILAGDTFTKNRCCPWDDAASYFGHPVVMVPGNHEFYGGTLETTVPKLKTAGVAKSVTILDNEQIIVAGVRILGCTLWTDFRLFAGDDLDRVKDDANLCVGTRYSSGLSDFRTIRVAKAGYRRFRPLDAALLHNASVSWLSERLVEPFDGPTVVVTHHAPSILCVPASLLEDRMTAGYASRLDWLIEQHQPDLWIWGHIHEAVPPFKIGRTRMVSNPRGYVGQGVNPSFLPDLVVEVGSD